MGINTDLNIDPYFDDFDQTKQFSRVLFRPARAVQARELTQLQTILQNQVERFGSNVYKEGTIISGVNISNRPDIYYVKITDSGITDPNVYSQTYTDDGVARNFQLEGAGSGLIADIIIGENGFETRAPNLKTFYIVYKNTTTSGTTEIKRFNQGETLKLIDPDGNEVPTNGITVATVSNHAGSSYGMQIDEGIIFQKGHFIFVEEQFVIISKYDNIPDDVSVGFSVEESIVEYGADLSLLDNAQGFNNVNAPGADRLKLRPVLTAVASGSEPEEFFAIARFESGSQISLRDVTAFNVVAEAMARRTYEESGNYTIRGLDVSLQIPTPSIDADENPIAYAVISPGKAYAFGHEVINMSPRKLRIPFESETTTKLQQAITSSYGQYFVVDTAHDVVLNSFTLGAQADLFATNGSTKIGTCFVRSVSPGRIYVFGIEKLAGQETSPIFKIADTPITQAGGVPIPVRGTRNSALIFNGGNPTTKSIQNVLFTKRMKQVITSTNINTSTNVVVIPNTSQYTPKTSNIVLVTSQSRSVEITNITTTNGDISITYNDTNILASGEPAFVYFDAIFSGTNADTIQQMTVYVKTTVSAGVANLGLPNVVKIESIINQASDGTGTEDVTGRFTLNGGQKDGYYDKSSMSIKRGATAVQAGDILLVKMIVFRRISNVVNGYLDASSYANVDANLIRNYSSNEGRVYSLLGSIDFRPYAGFQGSYAISAQGAENIGARTALNFSDFIPISDGGTIIADFEYYLPRFDAIAIDDLGEFVIIKGNGSENPRLPNLTDVFTLGELYVPGVPTAITGDNAMRLKSRSTRNYTMRDIEQIDKKVDRLTEAVSLSLLESEAESLTITDANGDNRFKNGILVDNFKSLLVADMIDTDFKASIEQSYRIATPSIQQFPIDLEVSGNSNVTNYADISLLSDDGNKVKVIDQKFATDYRNAVSNFYNYKGKMQLYPEFDSGYDVINNPAVNIGIDIATPILDLVENLQEFVPLTRSSSSSSTSSNTTNGGGGRTISTTTSITTVTESLVSEVTESTASVGEFVTDINFRPYLQRRLVQIYVTGLRANTVHHLFFDEENVDRLVRPGALISNSTTRGTATGVTARQVYPVGTYTDNIRTDGSGVLAAVFEIPESTYFVGEHEVRVADVDQYSSISSGGTSRAKGAYRGYNFDVGKTELTTTTRTPSFDVDETVTTTHNTTSRFIPNPRPDPNPGEEGWESCFVAGTIVSLADGAKKKIEEVEIGEKLIGQDGSINTVLEFDHPPLNGRDLVGINESGPFCTPEHPVFTKDGWKAPRMNDTLVAYPHLESIMVGDLAVGDEILTEQGDYITVETIEWHTDEKEQQVFNFILDGNNTYFADGLLVHNRDPLSQTFFVKRGMARGATSIFIRDVDLFFKARANGQSSMADVTTNGVTIEMREVINGYPAEAVLPFGKKHLKPSEVSLSDDASVATNIVFDNPLRLNVEKEYAIVVAPDALDPNYLVFTSKVGGTDLQSGLSVTHDWGDGVLFTSTNNKAWKSYQDEDVKFKLNRLEFAGSSGSVDFVPKKMEFLSLSGLANTFSIDELVYTTKSNVTYPVTWTGYNLLAGTVAPTTGYTDNIQTAQTITIPQTTVNFSQGDYVLITQGAHKHLAKVLTLTETNASTVIILDTPPSAFLDAASTALASIQLAVAGKVSHWDRRNPNVIHLKESSASVTKHFVATDVIYGTEGTGTATVVSVDDISLSYFQPMIYQSNTSRTFTSFKLKNDDSEGTYRAIPSNDATYLTNGVKKINSTSNIVNADPNTAEAQSFVVKVGLNNGGYTTSSPIIDDDLSTVNAYQYKIANVANDSSSYVSKKVILEDEIDAVGLKVILSAYRPPGTMIDVQAKFVYPEDMDSDSGWISLDQASGGDILFSNASNIRDYREFEYDLNETTYDIKYTSFQVRIIMRHATGDEMIAQGLSGITPDVHIFAHINDYRAIALT